MQRPKFFAARRNRSGRVRYYWKPSAPVSRAGFKLKRLNDDADTAMVEAAALNDTVAQRDPDLMRLRTNGQPWVASGVYVLGHTACPVKIGRSGDAPGRRKDLQTGHPGELQLWAFVRLPDVAGGTLERWMHDHFRDRRRGGEWFDVSASEATIALLRGIESVRVATRGGARAERAPPT